MTALIPAKGQAQGYTGGYQTPPDFQSKKQGGIKRSRKMQKCTTFHKCSQIKWKQTKMFYQSNRSVSVQDMTSVRIFAHFCRHFHRKMETEN
ncbi:hypothetical protein Y1Q_0014386 [Alligator mississippiensis]|uniref:Uncharacterized protein n=1 Tax=Alligator mississippiensis TaxID=8496 RepID=A0A151PDC1_ALLMI|nr:hypothetical protein Y1Q_0014386 [Alligator mississippiensis]